jgi:hypothetical protein
MRFNDHDSPHCSKITTLARRLSPAPDLFCRRQKRASPHCWPAYIISAEIYFVQVLLIIFTSVTLKLPIASLLDAFSTCPSFFSSTFVSGLAVPVTVT